MALGLGALVSGAGGPVLAQAAKPCDAPGFHGWDFWLGSWRVTDPQGALQGTNDITRAPSGCGMIENWTSAQGGRGTSFNVYDATRGTWTQLWASPGVVIRLEGTADEHGAIRTEGEIAYGKTRVVHPFRGVWTPNPDGSVTQEFFEQDPATKAWSQWFKGVYRKAT